jgi:hypothetical protein
MPVKFYIGRDLQNYTHYPDTSHESQDVRQICQFLWRGWQHDSSRHYAVVASPKRIRNGREIQADLVIISEYGLGVVEMKKYFGGIRCDEPKGAWFAGPKLIEAGAKTGEKDGYANPHEQVQSYAHVIQEGMIAAGALPGEPDQWDDFKFHTAVCFTNPKARIEACKNAVTSPWWRKALQPWEKFAVLKSNEVFTWASDLRFEVDKGPAFNYLPQAWSGEEVYTLAEEFFGARPWVEMTESMPPLDKPMAYLSLQENNKTIFVYGLMDEIVTIGRANESTIRIPEKYEGVSRNHALIRREIGGFSIEDVSKNGTFVGGKKLKKHQLSALKDGDVVQLGPRRRRKAVCHLEFSLTTPPPPPTTLE